MRNRQRPRHDVRDDDLIRARQYRGVDRSGYERAPQETEGYDAGGEWREPAPGNYGEAGGRWHDHEGPFQGGRPIVGMREGGYSPAPPQPRAGFLDQARELWSGGPGGTYGYGQFGREGRAPEAEYTSGPLGASKPASAINEARREPGPHAGKGPKGYARSDERIREDICEQLTEHDEIDARGITVTVKDAEVILEGEIDSRSTKRAVEELAANVRGVHDVLNQLRVKRAELRETRGQARTPDDEATGHATSIGTSPSASPRGVTPSSATPNGATPGTSGRPPNGVNRRS